jgi:hypothetical protein
MGVRRERKVAVEPEDRHGETRVGKGVWHVPECMTGPSHRHGRPDGWLCAVSETVDPAATPVAGHHERLSVPLRWWVQGTMLVATFWLAFVVSTPGVVAWTATGVLVLLMAGLFLGYGAPRVVVEDGWLRAGRARISGEFLAGAEPLDADATRRVAGREADARAYLLLRPYLKRAVRVTVQDRRDPTPYWLVSSRDPEHLAAAIRVICGADSSR